MPPANVNPTVERALSREPDKVMLAGDWHGNARWAEVCCQHAYRNGADAILQLGDFGFWTEGRGTDEYLSRVERAASKGKIRVFWVDGNHEDHSRFAEFNDPARPMTTHLPRGHRWTWWGKRFMALGGAFSVDRFCRTEGVDWWPGEKLSEDDVARASRDDGTPVDVVVAHDCPTGVHIPGVGADWGTQHRGVFPDHMLYQASLHRDEVRKVYDATRPGLWAHGHYHRMYGFEQDGTKFLGLNMDGTSLLESTAFLSGEGLEVGPHPQVLVV